MIFPDWEILAGKGGGAVERFACETEVVSGEGALSVLGEKNWKRILVVTDRKRPGDGALEKLLGNIHPEHTAFWENVDPEPSLRQAVDGAKQVKTWQPDAVVAVGGRNVLDCAKAMVCFSRGRCRLAVIPTVFGSGAETMGRVNLFHDRSRHTMVDAAMRPDLTLLEPVLLDGLSRSETAEGGFLILANSLEVCTAKHCGTLAGLHGKEAFVSCWAALSAAVTGSRAARERLGLASAMTGIACHGTGLGLVHAISGGLESVFHVPEGRLAGILLPVVLRYNAGASQRRCAELGRSVGLGGGSPQAAVKNLIGGLIRLRQELGLPATLAQAGVDPGIVRRSTQRIVRLTLESGDCRNNPVPVDDFMIRRILEEIAGHY